MKYLLFFGGLLSGAALVLWNPVALCVGCNLVEADADRKYCLACYELMIAPLRIGTLCCECKCSVDEHKCIEKRINGRKCCDVCFDLFASVNDKEFFVNAQEEYLREVAKRKRLKDKDND